MKNVCGAVLYVIPGIFLFVFFFDDQRDFGEILRGLLACRGHWSEHASDDKRWYEKHDQLFFSGAVHILFNDDLYQISR